MYTLEGEKVVLPLFMKMVGSGKEGKVYQVNSELALKKYRSNMPPSELERQKKNAIHLTGVHIANFVCPTKVLVNKDQTLKAYLMPLVLSKKEKEIPFLSVPVFLFLWEELLQSLSQFVDETDLILLDKNCQNLLVGDHLYLIDTPSYQQRSPYLPKDQTLKCCQFTIAEMLVRRILKDVLVQTYKEKKNQSEEQIREISQNADDLKHFLGFGNIKLLEKRYLGKYENVVSILKEKKH